MTEDSRNCPFCGEEIKYIAVVCKHCHRDIQDGSREKNGKLIRVRMKAGEKIYIGDIFLPSYLYRVSDVINDNRHFIVLSNALEEGRTRNISIGFLAINKNHTEWIELQTTAEEQHSPSSEVRYIFTDQTSD